MTRTVFAIALIAAVAAVATAGKADAFPRGSFGGAGLSGTDLGSGR